MEVLSHGGRRIKHRLDRLDEDTPRRWFLFVTTVSPCQFRNLSRISLVKANLGDVFMDALVLSIRACTGIRYLRLAENKFSETHAGQIADIVARNPCLDKLLLPDNYLHDGGACAVTVCLPATVTVLNLDMNCLEGRAGSSFVWNLHVLVSLKNLSVAFNDLDPLFLKDLFSQGLNLSSLTYLSLSDNERIADQGLELISAALVRLCSLQSLVLSRCGISGRGALSFMEILPPGHTLTHLYFYENVDIGFEVHRLREMFQQRVPPMRFYYPVSGDAPFSEEGDDHPLFQPVVFYEDEER